MCCGFMSLFKPRYRATRCTGFSHGSRPSPLRGRGQQRHAAEAEGQRPRAQAASAPGATPPGPTPFPPVVLSGPVRAEFGLTFGLTQSLHSTPADHLEEPKSMLTFLLFFFRSSRGDASCIWPTFIFNSCAGRLWSRPRPPAAAAPVVGLGAPSVSCRLWQQTGRESSRLWCSEPAVPGA